MGRAGVYRRAARPPRDDTPHPPNRAKRHGNIAPALARRRATGGERSGEGRGRMVGSAGGGGRNGGAGAAEGAKRRAHSAAPRTSPPLHRASQIAAQAPRSAGD